VTGRAASSLRFGLRRPTRHLGPVGRNK